MGLYVGNTKYKVMSGNNKASLFPVYPYNSEVEYLETNGGCNIYTDYIPSGNNIRIKGKFKYNGYTDNTQWLGWYSAYTNEQTQTFRIIRYTSTNDKVYLYNGSKASGGGALAPIEIGGIYEFDFNKNALVFNGVNYNITLNNTANTGQLYIFNIKFKGRFYYLKVYDNDILIHDYIPVRVNQTGYVYDRVTNKLFGNNPNVSGSIILGPDKPIYDAEVEYLESDGGTYIDTGIVATQNTKIQWIGSIPNYPQSEYGHWFFGYYGSTIRFGAFYNQNTNKLTFYRGNSSRAGTLTLAEGALELNSINDSSILIITNNGNSYSITRNANSFETPSSIYLFTVNVDGGPALLNNKSGTKLSSCKILQGTSVVLDLIPVRVGTTGYMYDTISHKLFGNAGTGSFILGNDKN